MSNRWKWVWVVFIIAIMVGCTPQSGNTPSSDATTGQNLSSISSSVSSSGPPVPTWEQVDEAVWQQIMNSYICHEEELYAHMKDYVLAAFDDERQFAPMNEAEKQEKLAQISDEFVIVPRFEIGWFMRKTGEGELWPEEICERVVSGEWFLSDYLRPIEHDVILYNQIGKPLYNSLLELEFCENIENYDEVSMYLEAYSPNNLYYEEFVLDAKVKQALVKTELLLSNTTAKYVSLLYDNGVLFFDGECEYFLILKSNGDSESPYLNSLLPLDIVLRRNMV